MKKLALITGIVYIVAVVLLGASQIGATECTTYNIMLPVQLALVLGVPMLLGYLSGRSTGSPQDIPEGL